AGFAVQENATPVFPVAPTIIGENDPYNSFAPVIRARVAAVVAEVVEPGDDEEAAAATDQPAQEIGNNGIPVARPVMNESEGQDLPAQRVRLPAPRAIEFD
ncbi:MAG TPA: hypothetical protein PK648_11205, partial [Verrucomicrobiales bacterium]|nr:hypothetical protein [Verrucomicrobiales bacterium]